MNEVKVATASTQFSEEEFREFFEKVFKTTRANIFLKIEEEHKHVKSGENNIKFLYNAEILAENASVKSIYNAIMLDGSVGSIFDQNPKFQVTRLFRTVFATPYPDLMDGNVKAGTTLYSGSTVDGWNSYTATGRNIIRQKLNDLKTEEDLLSAAVGIPDDPTIHISCSYLGELEIDPESEEDKKKITFGFYKDQISGEFCLSLSADVEFTTFSEKHKDREFDANAARAIGTLEDRFGRYVDITGKLSKNTLILANKTI